MVSEEERRIRDFKFEKVLNADTGRKVLNLLGTIDGQPAILIAERTFFNTEDLSSFNQTVSGVQDIALIEHNDIYHWFLASLHQDTSKSAAAKLALIFPCTETHVRKYSAQLPHVVVETPEVYEKYVKKYVDAKRSGGRLNWVENILTHKAEADRIIFEDTSKDMGFILLPDFKWDRVTSEQMYLCAITHRDDIGSLRDITTEHISYLKHVRDKTLEAVHGQYPTVGKDQIKIYLHYQPSYYHFHLHVVHISHDMGNSSAAGKAWLVEQVIAILEAVKAAGGDPEVFKRMDITYVLGEEHELWAKIFGPLKAGEEPSI